MADQETLSTPVYVNVPSNCLHLFKGNPEQGWQCSLCGVEGELSQDGVTIEAVPPA